MRNYKNSDQAQHAIETLLQLPVGRRWVLKLAGLGAVGGLVGLAGCGGGSRNDGSDIPDEPLTVPRTLQFTLRQAKGYQSLRLVVGGQSIWLTRHSAATRNSLARSGGVWEKINTSMLTHYAQVAFPTNNVQLATVYGVLNGQECVVVQAFLIPESATILVAEATHAISGSYAAAAGSPERLAALQLDGARVSSAHEVVQIEQVLDAFQTAEALTMMHPNIATRAGIEAAATRTLLHQTPEVSVLGNYISQMQQNGRSFAKRVLATNAHGQPTQITVMGSDKAVKTTFSTIELNHTDATFVQTARSAFIAGIHGVRDTESLGMVIDKPLDRVPPNTKTWHQPEGLAITPTPYTSSSDANVTISIQNEGLLFGTYTAVRGAASGASVPLTLYNNYVRWVSVYVQYLRADGAPLPFKPVGRDTAYAQWVGLLQQVYTVLGIPLWDTNSLDVTLEFPSEATTARLLYCGLGNDLVGNGWRRYFPKDAYPDGIAPTDEVQDAAFITAIFSIGLTAFTLASDIDIAAAYGAIKAIVGENLAVLADELKRLFKAGEKIFSVLESYSVGVISGETTYNDLKEHNLSFHDIWAILASIGAIFTKIFLNQTLVSASGFGTLFKISKAVTTLTVVEKTIEAIPILGEILAVLAIAGDVATLAEAIGETAASPWVIANQISRTYPVTLTVSRDIRAPTWPATARTWEIQTKIDDAVATTPIQGQFNALGNEFKPIVLNLNGLFGGSTITWTIVVLDANGHQVATGASAQLPNNNAANPPSNVGFAVIELPAVITANTVFKRTVTTMYNNTLNGYTWANAPTDNSTRLHSGIQEIACVTVATRLGVAGIVFKQNDRYWLRGVPLAQNGGTITFGGATRQGYTRPPFLLFDALVGQADIANHVMLEPDDASDGYHVRALAIDPHTGALSWDSSVSLGYFFLPVSAAALHSSGHVVAIHTNTGRLGRLLPANTSTRPPLAAYTAGPGRQVGLLSSPTAVAITAPGTIIVLNAGASQLAAFDLNGNPVRQFGNTSVKNFTLPLLASREYLDVAVDGSGDIYLLSYQGDGSQVSEYHIDVVNPRGNPVSTFSTRDNVPHLAVDYWRSIYAANYTPLLDSNGRVHVDPSLGVAEPSLSRFDPF